MGRSSPFAFVGTLVGGGIGALGGPLGALKGAQVGATVGTVAQGIFGPKDTAKAGDARWGGSTFGTAIARGWGRHRTDCPVFWGVRNTDGTYLFPHDVGKSKGKSSTNTVHYHATFAFAILETGLTFPDGRQVERAIVVDRVWMADHIVWQNPSAVPIPAWSSTTAYAFGDHVTRNGNTWTSQADSNLGHGPGNSGNAQWWSKVTSSKNCGLNIHPDPSSGESTFTMAASSIMVSHDGVKNVPAYRGLTYGLVSDLDLYDVGNTVPQNVSVEWHWATPCTLGDLLSDGCGLSGMPEGSYDFSDVTDVLTGYRQVARQSGSELIAAPIWILGYDLATVDGVLRAIKRGGPITATITADELAAAIEGGSGNEDGDLVASELPADRLDLHSSLRLGFANPAAGFRQDFETATRGDQSRENPLDVTTELVLTVDQAAQGAGFLLDSEYLEGGATFGISLLGTRSAICGGDAIEVPWPTQGLLSRFRVIKTELAENLVKLSLARDEPRLLGRSETGDGALSTVADDGQIAPTAFVVMSPPVDLSNNFAEYAGFYVFANGPAGWRGGQVVFTFDPPTAANRNWVTGPTVSTASTFGTTLGALDDPNAATAAPVAPTNLAAAAGNAQLALSWSASSGATSYSVKRSTVSGGPYAVVQSGIASPSFTDTGLANGTTYRYVVSATNAGGESPNSAEVSATPVQPVMTPAAPTNLTAQGGSGFVNLAWSSSSGATSYSVQRSTSSGNETALTSGLTSTSYTDSTVAPGTTYYYLVTATNSAGTSGSSNEASALTAPASTTLTAVAGTGQIALSWPTTSGATSYTLKRGTASGSHPTTVVSGLAGTMYTDIGLTNGTAYYYVVEAVNAGGAGADSMEATATPIAIPTGLAATAGDGQISLAWNPAAGATGYKIYVGTTSGGPYPTMSTTGTDSAIVSGLTNGTTYFIIVTGTNAHGESNASAQVSATPTSSGSGTTNPPTQNPQDPGAGGAQVGR